MSLTYVITCSKLFQHCAFKRQLLFRDQVNMKRVMNNFSAVSSCKDSLINSLMMTNFRVTCYGVFHGITGIPDTPGAID